MPDSKTNNAEPPGEGEGLEVNLRAEDMTVLDAWIDAQDPKPTRAEALRSLVELALRFSNPAIGLKEAEEFISDLRRRARYPQPPDAPMFRAARKLKADYRAAHPDETSGSNGQ